MGLGKRPAENREVLAEHEGEPAVDGAVAGHHPIAGNLLPVHAEIAAAVLDEPIPFLKAAFVKQKPEALPRRELALGVLLLDAALAAAQEGCRRLGLQSVNIVVHGSVPTDQRPRIPPLDRESGHCFD